MSKKLGQEPAFPVDEKAFQTVLSREHEPIGMSKRFYAACAAMQGMLANMEFLKLNGQTGKENGYRPDEFLVMTAYGIADELLKQESEETK